MSKDRLFHQYLILEILTNSNRVILTKKDILGKNPPPISLLTYMYYPLKIYFAPFLKS